MYTLILTIVLIAGYGDGGVSASTHHIGGFSSQAKCKEAGNLWLKTVKTHTRVSKSALCVAK